MRKARASKNYTEIILSSGKKLIITFCADCGEHIMLDGRCSNPICPEEIGDCNDPSE